jgi:hypothetical protein
MTCKNVANIMQNKIISSFAENLKSEYGFDIFHPFQTKWYNDSIASDPSTIALRRLEISHKTTHKHCTNTTSTDIAFLIGNTKHMWPYFVRAHQRRIISRMSDEYIKNPLDTYVKESIQEIVSKYFERRCKYRIYWECSYDIDNLVSMQRVAVISGLSYYDNESMLCVHPVYGTWHSFRAVVVIDELFEHEQTCIVPQQPPEKRRCFLSVSEKTNAASSMKYASNLVSFQKQESIHNESQTTNDELKTARAWIELRDCIEVGRAQYRFGKNQLLYHYTNDSKFIQFD